MKGYKIFVPLEKAQQPAEGHVYVNKWWAVHPQHGVLFYTDNLRNIEDPRPQCNSDQNVTERLAKKLWPDCEVMFLPVVFATQAYWRKVAMRHNITEQKVTA